MEADVKKPSRRSLIGVEDRDPPSLRSRARRRWSIMTFVKEHLDPQLIQLKTSTWNLLRHHVRGIGRVTGRREKTESHWERRQPADRGRPQLLDLGGGSTERARPKPDSLVRWPGLGFLFLEDEEIRKGQR
ncbi:hypothetical protein CRG98_037697 [Punica granatum]|uniref:Uncharacterized protein n=1 Tax=Punica granatum TaxID=22663 RepID=A0A2I0ID78_PUNGR|nr:hypothetical protein CRG98_037697 [Punica granatum]